jgi:hypothetical protein
VLRCAALRCWCAVLLMGWGVLAEHMVELLGNSVSTHTAAHARTQVKLKAVVDCVPKQETAIKRLLGEVRMACSDGSAGSDDDSDDVMACCNGAGGSHGLL